MFTFSTWTQSFLVSLSPTSYWYLVCGYILMTSWQQFLLIRACTPDPFLGVSCGRAWNAGSWHHFLMPAFYTATLSEKKILVYFFVVWLVVFNQCQGEWPLWYPWHMIVLLKVKLFWGLSDRRMEKIWVRFGCWVLPG